MSHTDSTPRANLIRTTSDLYAGSLLLGATIRTADLAEGTADR